MKFTISDPADRPAVLQNWEQGANAMECEIHHEKAHMRSTESDVFIDACCEAFRDRLVARCREIEEVRGGN